jgi:hypothetical protein
MLAVSRTRILERLSDDDVVLDIGGWADPFERADWVIDVMPYETRGLYAREGWIPSRRQHPERFNGRTWIQRDLCDRESYPFGDGEVDFVVCSQTLEDLRDPIWVCSEINRIGRAGYLEVPSRLEEQSWGVAGEFVGWPHHRWLTDVKGSRIEFVLKPHDLHAHPSLYFPAGFWNGLNDEERAQTLWWEGGFDYAERLFIQDSLAVDYLPGFVARELAARGVRRRGAERLRRRLARLRRGS